MKKSALYFLILVSAGELISIGVDLPPLRVACKPLLMIGLLLYYITSVIEMKGNLSATVVLALLFSWAGDVLLMISAELFFVLGLLSFLLAHINYLFAFRQFRNDDPTKGLQGVQKVRFAFPIIIYGSGLVIILLPHLNGLTVPVLGYAAVLTAMGLAALFRFQQTSTASFAMVFGGAMLFMISDSILALNKFVEPIAMASFWIMVTYITAQFLIIRGILTHR